MGLSFVASAATTVDMTGIEQQIADVAAAAKAADDRAANARQMVLNRDPRLTSLEDVAGRSATEIARTDMVHAELQAGIDQALARTMIPGKDGAPGQPGKDGSNAAANLAIGAAPVPAILLGGTRDVVVPLSRPMPSTTYTAQAAHSAVVNLATATLTVTARTTTSVTVRITSVGVAIAAGTLILAAF